VATNVKDAVVVGGGIGGLAAAWELRDLDALVLEAEDRVGGRIKSFERGSYWVSVGAHMFPGEGSALAGLVADLGLELAPLRGELLGLAYGGKIVSGGRPETFPLRLPLSAGGRLSLARAGLKVRRGAGRYNMLARPQPGETASDVRARLLAFLDDRSFAAYLGRLHPQAEAIFRATANRLTAEPEEVAAGCIVGLFAHVWSEGGVTLGFNLRTGPASLPQEIERRLGDRVLTRARVTEVARDDGGVRVRYVREGAEDTVHARTAIVATTANVAREIVSDLPAETAEALDAIVYGPFVVGGILTNETGPMPWDGTYSVLTADKRFNMLFNHASWRRDPAHPREPGGALMVYGGANRARQLMEKSDDEIAAAIVDDLVSLYPEAKGVVEEVVVQRWERAIPFAAPGRHRFQAALERGVGDAVFFAGDYVGEWTHMESAVLTAQEAAAKARATLTGTARGGIVAAAREEGAAHD
jgi:protoporphyrinogen/coproporphyrinogen III oxidase